MNLSDNQEKQVEKISNQLKNLFEKISNNINELESFSEKLRCLQNNLSDFIEDYTRSKEEISAEDFIINLNQFESQLNELEIETDKFLIEKVGFSEHIINPSIDIDNQSVLIEINKQEIESLLEKIKKLNNLKISSSFRESLKNIQTSLKELLQNKNPDSHDVYIDIFKNDLALLEKQINDCNEAITNIAGDEVPTWNFTEQLQNQVMESSAMSPIKTLYVDIEPQRLETHQNIDKTIQKISSDTKSLVWKETIDELKLAVNRANTVEDLSILQSMFEYKLEQYTRIVQTLGSVDFISCNPTFPHAIACATNREEIDNIFYNTLSNSNINSINSNYCDVSLLGSSRTNNSAQTIEDDEDDELAQAIALSMGQK